MLGGNSIYVHDSDFLKFSSYNCNKYQQMDFAFQDKDDYMFNNRTEQQFHLSCQ